MTVTVRLFAVMAQHARTGQVALELPAGATVGEVRRELLRRDGQLPWPGGTMWAVNQEYAGEDAVLNDGDEVAIIPPVSGG